MKNNVHKTYQKIIPNNKYSTVSYDFLTCEIGQPS